MDGLTHAEAGPAVWSALSVPDVPQKMAIGFTGRPVVPVTAGGASTSMKLYRCCLEQTAARSSTAVASTRGSPSRASATWRRGSGKAGGGAAYRPAPGGEGNRHDRASEADVPAGANLGHRPRPGRIIDEVQRTQLIGLAPSSPVRRQIVIGDRCRLNSVGRTRLITHALTLPRVGRATVQGVAEAGVCGAASADISVRTDEDPVSIGRGQCVLDPAVGIPHWVIVPILPMPADRHPV